MSAVISAFPATGKTYVADRYPNVVDSDSSAYPKGRAWPGNYIADIERHLADGKTILVSSHQEVREALVDAGIPFALVYPRRDLRREYRKRMEFRGSPAALVEKIDGLWDVMLDSMERQGGCTHYVLGPGDFLADILDP